ncbi:MAG: radical SAM protein [Bacillota bacterium]|nr:radical SAM protein [Bacillota bacterium]
MERLSFGDQIKAFGLKRLIGYVDKDPDKNIPKIVDRLLQFDIGGDTLTPQVRVIKQQIENKDSNWYKLVKSLWTDIDDGIRRTLFENFIINAGLLGPKRQLEVKAKEGCSVPWAILLDPTSACNLHCVGCWASEYGDKMNLSFEQLDDIICQAKEMGTFMFLFSGGEPLVRKDDIIKLCEKHSDCAFSCFTNGTLIDEAFADELLRVKNFVPGISIEGFEEATDQRRGKGTYRKVLKAMDILKRKKIPFGISSCYTSANVEAIGSEEFFDEMIERGAKFMWLFTYMPVGTDAVPELMATAEQREFMYHQVRKFRNTKEIFTVDFWNDGEYVGGCIAGGRSYLHINANGDIEPCAFIHYSDTNIKEHTLLEAYKNPMFMEYYKGQPFSDNMLRPCPLLDNKGKLAEMVNRSGAHSTDMKDPENADDLCAKCNEVADRWKVAADKLWTQKGHHNYAGPRKRPD